MAPIRAARAGAARIAGGEPQIVGDRQAGEDVLGLRHEAEPVAHHRMGGRGR